MIKRIKVDTTDETAGYVAMVANFVLMNCFVLQPHIFRPQNLV